MYSIYFDEILRTYVRCQAFLFHMFMTGYVLIEDERFACEEMNRMMRKLRPEYSCLGSAGSVEEAVALLKRTRPDLMLVDVSLADGICFEIFDQVPEDIPVIFTTAGTGLWSWLLKYISTIRTSSGAKGRRPGTSTRS